jgi:diguanylate cyclase (GGDEF)-like protein
MLNTHVALYTLDIVALLFLYGLMFSNNLLSKPRKMAFTVGIILTVFIIIAEVGTVLTQNGSSDLRVLNILFNVIGFSFTPVIAIVLLAIFDSNVLQKSLLFLIPTFSNIILVLLSPWYGLIFNVDINNTYTRGSLFFFFVFVYIFNIIFLVISTLGICQKSLYPIKWKIIALSLFTIGGSFIQLLFPSVYASWHLVTLSMFLFYILLTEFDGSFDRLTNLYNRLAFEKAIKQLSSKKTFSIIAMDINDFKEINDTHGHEYGDIVLKEVSVIIKESFNNGCSWYRIGGDEFCVICNNTDMKLIEKQLKQLTDNLTKKRSDDTCLPTIAYGYSVFKADKPLDFKQLLNEADAQMYYYKQLNREQKPIK